MSSAISVQDVTHYFGSKCVVNHVSFEVRQGEIFGLLGRNGAGKTTIMRMLPGLLAPTRGRTALLGCESSFLTPEVREKVAFLAEGHHLYGWMSIGRAAQFARESNRMWDEARFASLMRYFGLESKQLIKSLSNGQRAQVSLALALACRPAVLIMDDPTLGVDAAIRQDFLRGIIDIVSQEECTVLLSTHVMEDVERLCDRIGILDNGILRVNSGVNEFKQAVRRFVLRFPGAVPGMIDLPRLVCSSMLQNELHVTVFNYGDDTRKAMERMGPASIEPVNLTLEEAFVDYTVNNRERQLFLSETVSDQEVSS